MKFQIVFLSLSWINAAPTDFGIGGTNTTDILDENDFNCLQQNSSCYIEEQTVYKRLTAIPRQLPSFDPFLRSGVHNCPPHRRCMSSFGVGVAQTIIGKKDPGTFNMTMSYWDSVSNLMKSAGSQTPIKLSIRVIWRGQNPIEFASKFTRGFVDSCFSGKDSEYDHNTLKTCITTNGKDKIMNTINSCSEDGQTNGSCFGRVEGDLDIKISSEGISETREGLEELLVVVSDTKLEAAEFTEVDRLLNGLRCIEGQTNTNTRCLKTTNNSNVTTGSPTATVNATCNPFNSGLSGCSFTSTNCV